MKTPIFIVLLGTLFISFPVESHAMFGHVAQERERRITTEQQLAQQEQLAQEQHRLVFDQQNSTRRWQIVASLAGAGITAALLIGAAVGSKARRDHES